MYELTSQDSSRIQLVSAPAETYSVIGGVGVTVPGT